MERIKSFQEFINESVSRNSDLFALALEEKGLSYNDVFNKLKEYALDEEFSDCLTPFGLVKGEDGKYKSHKEYHMADFGKRTSGELKLDSKVGLMQKYLFLMNNKSFKWNPDAKAHKDVVRIPDFLCDDARVMFRVNYNKVSGGTIKYPYRDSDFKYFLNDGNILIVYFIKENKVAVIGRSNCTKKDEEGEKDSKITFEKIRSTTSGKLLDVITINESSLIDYDMFKEGDNPEIRDKVNSIANMNKQLPPPEDWKTDRFYRTVGASDEEMGINRDKSHRRWKDENYNKCLRKWKELVKQSKSEYPGASTKANKDKRWDWVAKQFDEFVTQEGIKKWTGHWKEEFSRNIPIE